MGAPLEIRDLEVRYGDTVALTDVKLDLPAGTSLAVIGPNGSGKSTLLNAIARIAPVAAGAIRYRGSTPALVLQSTEVDRSLPITVSDTVALGRYATLGFLGRFGATLTATPWRTLSDDSASRISPIGSSMNCPAASASACSSPRASPSAPILLMLDEPVTGLDVVSRGLILDVINDELAAGRSVILTTHDLDDARLCDQVLLVDKHAIAVGPPDEVLTEDNLIHAFGGRFIRVGDRLILDDPHHHQQH